MQNSEKSEFILPHPAALPVVQAVPVILRTAPPPGGGYRPPAAGAGDPRKYRKN